MFYDCIKEEPEEEEESICGALLNINVRFSGGHTKTLSIYENDIIEEKVDKFCSKHSLNESIKEMLTQQVISQLDNQIIELEQSQKNTQSSNHSSFNINDQIDTQLKQSFGDFHQQQQYLNGSSTSSNNNNHVTLSIPTPTPTPTSTSTSTPTPTSNGFKAEIKELNYEELPLTTSIVLENKKLNKDRNTNKHKDSIHITIKNNSLSQSNNHSKSKSKSRSKRKPRESTEKNTKTSQLKKISIPTINLHQIKGNNSKHNKNNPNIKAIQVPKKRNVNSSPSSPPNSITSRHLNEKSPLSKPKQSLPKSNSHRSLTPSKELMKETTPHMNKKVKVITKSPSRIKTEPHSNKSLEVMQMKILKYKELFDILDSDNDGLISSKHINLSIISKELLKSLTPILGELQKTEMRMQFKEFCIRVDKILSVSSAIKK